MRMPANLYTGLTVFFAKSSRVKLIILKACYIGDKLVF